MRFASTLVTLLAVLAAIAPAGSLAAEKSLGQQEFESRCASCHGVGGKGDGWLAKYLSRPSPPLTQLKKKNGGRFPYDYAYQIVDGRKEVEMHGPREMPVWGAVIPTEIERKSFGQAVAGEKVARLRMRALVEYLSNLQE